MAGCDARTALDKGADAEGSETTHTPRAGDAHMRTFLLLDIMDEIQRKTDIFILKAWLSVLKDVQREYPRHTIDNAIMQIESRIKHLTQHD